jgi:NTE family protein
VNAGLHGRVGIALGSGAARGLAHIGVLRGLAEAGIVPDIVCGSSIGAVVGAAFASGTLDSFDTWVRGLDWRRLVGTFDFALRGGLLKGRKVFEILADQLPDRPIVELERTFGAVATDLVTGQEVWLRDGTLYDAMRASVALPGLITPARVNGRWLVDGGLVNPVPVSLCRAMGADTVIAVDLNTVLVGRRFRGQRNDIFGRGVAERALPPALQEIAAELRARIGRGEDSQEGRDALANMPSMYEVITGSINIMQVRISRSRMAGDPPDLLVAPRLADFALLDFDRADEAIEEGRRAVAAALVPGTPTPQERL